MKLESAQSNKIDDKLACIYRWNWLVINFKGNLLTNCCKAEPVSLSPEDIEKHRSQLFLNHPEVLKSRMNLLLNKKDKDCSYCWANEERGVMSSRQAWNGTGRFISSPYAQGVSLQEQAKANSPERLEIVLDDSCNLECMYCDHERSTRWQKRIGFNRSSLQQEQSALLRKLFWEWLSENGGGLKMVSLSGGETFLGPNFDEAIENLKNICLKFNIKPTISAITNLSYPPALLKNKINRLLELNKITPVMIEFSNEGFAEKSEYIRWGLDWQMFTSNLDFLFSSAKELKFGAQMALNNLCITSFPNYLQFLRDKSVQHKVEVYPIVNYVATPSHLDPQLLTPDFAAYLAVALETGKEFLKEAQLSKKHWQDYQDFLKSIYEDMLRPKENKEFVIRGRKEFLKNIQSFDKSRSSDFLKTFPEYKNFYEMCENQA